MQRLEQIEQDKQAMEVRLGAMQTDIAEKKIKKNKNGMCRHGKTMRNLQSQDPIARETVMLEITDANQKSKEYTWI